MELGQIDEMPLTFEPFSLAQVNSASGSTSGVMQALNDAIQQISQQRDRQELTTTVNNETIGKGPGPLDKELQRQAEQKSGTNVSVTISNDQHINVFVPDNGDPVRIKKSDGVTLEYSDDETQMDGPGGHSQVKENIKDKIKQQVSRRVSKMNKEDSSTTEDDEDEKGGKNVDDKMKKVVDQLKHAREGTDSMKKHLSHQAKKDKYYTNLAQTEVDMVENFLAQADSDQVTNILGALAQINSQEDGNAAAQTDNAQF